MTQNSFIATKLNLDKHYTLLEDRDITYLLNGDIEGYDTGNQNYFVQNQKSNELCFELEDSFVGPGIPVGNSEHIFFTLGDTSNIVLANLDSCSYEVVASGDCLGFDTDYPIRGVYKYNSQTNSRRIYFIDGLNPNRYLDIDNPFPQVKITDDCETCEQEFSGELDCAQLNINKDITVPCITLEANNQGSLASGVYQVGFAWSQDGVILSDFYWSDVIKVWSEKDNIGLDINLDCVDTEVFNEYTLILVTNTREGSLILYRVGDYQFPNNRVTLTDLTNTTVVDLSSATQKKVITDYSNHITTNGETLLLGNSQSDSLIPYQIQATGIQIGWQEIKVPKDYAHLYPSFMRDEVYDFSIEWFKTKGQNVGRFHIPGRPYNDNWIYDPVESGGPYHEYDLVAAKFNIYSNPDCEEEEVSAWQLTSTAYTSGDFGGTCDECVTGSQYGLYGGMGYYECLDLTYPDEPDIWGELACQKIRRHRMPSHNLTHLYESGGCQLQAIEEVDDLGNETTVTGTIYAEGDCVNLLGIRVSNITPPVDSNGNLIPDILGFRILYSKRDGNKSILHKGLLYNVRTERTGDDGGEQETILFPNYPFNDGKPDVYLGTEEERNWDLSELGMLARGLSIPNYTYHSPDIHFKEAKNEFGSELKVYTSEVGGIFGSINKTYKHPEQSIFKSGGVVSASYLINYANTVNLIANFAKYIPWTEELEQSWLINDSQYLLPIKQFFGNKKVNNLYRETSYLMEVNLPERLNNQWPYYDSSEGEDTSRVLASDLKSNDFWDDIDIAYCTHVDFADLSNDYDLQAVSNYVGIKVPQPNQYGQIGSTTYTPVSSCIETGDVSGETFILMGGDIYISKHTVVRKFPLYQDWLYDVPFDTLINYRDKRNVYYPRFFFDNLTLDYSVLYRFDNRYESGGFVQGRFYTHVNGVSWFWCESEFIGDYRESDSREQTQFYPNQDLTELTRSDRFRDEHIWLYNFALLSGSIDQLKLSSLVNLKNSLDPDYNLADYIVNYSLKDDPQSSYDNWLTFLPLNYTVLPRVYGDFTGMHYIDQYSILFDFENGTLHSQEDYTLTINQGNSLFLAQGDIFSRRLRKWSNEQTGYTGSVDPFFHINTRYGLLYYDRYRKQFFMWTDQLKPLNDLKSFLNHFNDISNTGYVNSMISVYDNLTDKIYITDRQRGWTISFSPKVEGFISFHSFIPDWYVPHHNTYLSIKDNSLWKHNAEGYQSYYGTNYPFEVEFVIKNPLDTNLQDISLFVDYLDVSGYNQVIQRSDKFFNKAFIYNNRYSTGLLNLDLKDTDKPQIIQNQEQVGVAEVSQVQENIYRVNKLENNQTGSPNIQYGSDGVSYSIINTNQNKPPYQKSLLKGRWFKAHFIDDENEDSKIMVQLNISQTDDTKK